MVGWVGFSCLGLLGAENSLHQQKWIFLNDLTQPTDGNGEGARVLFPAHVNRGEKIDLRSAISDPGACMTEGWAKRAICGLSARRWVKA